MDRNRKFILSFVVFVVLIIIYAIPKNGVARQELSQSESPSKTSEEGKPQVSDERQKPIEKEVIHPKIEDNSAIVSSSDETTQKENSKEKTRKTLLDAVRRGVVIIKVKAYASVENSEASAWSGTGFIVDLEKGLIATNHHVAGNMTICTYEIKFSDGTKTTAKLKFFDPLLDFAFLTIDPKDFPKSSMALEISQRPIKVNDTIYSMGNSAGDEFSTYKGTVFSVYENVGPFPEQSFKFSGLTIGGASGSPVFGEDGKVVGIIYGGKFVSGAALPLTISLGL
jgi:S1-C subfamily serine protease